MDGPGCNCGPRSKGGATSSTGYPPSLRGGCGCGGGPALGSVPAPVPDWLSASVERASKVGDLVNILAASLAKAMKVKDLITNTYVGGKHQNEAKHAAAKLQLYKQAEAVRMLLVQAVAMADQLDPNDPIPPNLGYVVRQTGGYNVPTPMAFAPWVLEQALDDLAKRAEKDMRGNMPKIPGLPQTDQDWWLIAAVALGLVFLAGKVT